MATAEVINPTTENSSEQPVTTDEPVNDVTKSIFRNGRFWNPWDTWREDESIVKGGMKVMFKEKNNSGVPSQHILDETLPIVKPDIEEISTPPESGIRVTWIGHATVLAQFDGISILTDPIFTDRSGPVSWFKVLWGSWVIKGPNHSFYFAGDTAYCKAFKEIGQRYGPIDVAAIPVGATEPRWFKKNRHCNIDEAVQIHQDVKAQKSLGIHWGTFKMGSEYYLSPLTDIKASMESAGLPPEDFCVKKHGEIWHVFR